jgi:hypothetical protein
MCCSALSRRAPWDVNSRSIAHSSSKHCRKPPLDIGFVLPNWVNLFFPRFSFRFFKPHPRSTTVLVNELDARPLKGASYDLESCATRLTRSSF